MNADAAGVVLMENQHKSVFVAVGEYSSSDYSPDHFGSSSSPRDKMIHVVLKACTQLEALLPFPVVDNKGNILCRTLG